jgi:hypothetical protein
MLDRTLNFRTEIDADPKKDYMHYRYLPTVFRFLVYALNKHWQRGHTVMGVSKKLKSSGTKFLIITGKNEICVTYL